MTKPLLKRALPGLALLLGLSLAPSRAQAMSTEVRGVLRIGAYGLLGGTVLGVAAYPMTGKLRTVFVGSSIGLYLGLAIGTIYALQGDEVPPWQSSLDPFPSGGRFALSALEEASMPKPLVELRAPVLRF